MRNHRWDKLKTAQTIKREMGRTCVVDGCEEPLTVFQGPASDSCCRRHQMIEVNYGGVGRVSRPHTFHRNTDFTCDHCGWQILEDDRLSDIQDQMMRRQVARILLHGDHHLVRAADGGSNSADNIRSLCVVCHAKKTVLNQDNRRAAVSV